jgi:hypothetical protein
MDSNAKAKRAPFLDKVMNLGPRLEPEVEDAERSLKETRLAIQTPMLDVIFRDGRIRSFSYTYLAEVEFEPGDKLTLKFTSGAEIIVEGRGLARHRQLVRLHRADEIHECSQSELGLQQEEISQVESISIVEGEKS